VPGAWSLLAIVGGTALTVFGLWLTDDRFVPQLRDEPSVRGKFIRDVEADSDLSDELRRKVIATGLRALGGRHDELEVV